MGICGPSYQKVLENVIGDLTALRLACDVIEAQVELLAPVQTRVRAILFPELGVAARFVENCTLRA